jgi:transposase
VADLSPEAHASGTPTRSKTQQTGAEERSAMATRVVGLDLGARISYCEVKDEQVVERGSVAGIAELTRWLGPNTRPAKVAFEACREAWVVHDQLEAWGHEPLMIDTTRVRQLGIGQHKRKTDRIDAETIARALEVGRIPLAHVLSPQRRELRQQLSVRRALVETRAQYAVTLRGLVRAQGQRVPSCNPENLPRQLQEAGLDERTRLLTEPLVKMLQELTPQITQVEAKLAQLCAQEPVIQRLRTAPGVGPIVAAAFVSVIDEAKRFRRAHEVESYLGLVPSEDTSGKRKLGAITKQGNSYLRALLVEAAWCVFRLRDGEDPLKRWAESVEKRRGKRIAVVAVARRLAGVLWAMWRDGTVYNPTKLSLASGSGLSRHAHALSAEAEQQRAAVAPPGNRRRPATAKTSREVAMS